MTTRHSPLRVLKGQADIVAKTLKAAERGEPIDRRFAERVAEARSAPAIKVGLVMDDKHLILEIPWERIKELPEVTLSEWVLNQMRERRAEH